MTYHGIALPLFSLRSKKHSGPANFFDLLPLIDWCKEVGMEVIQLLPLNDTGLDPSPYSLISANALHPRYLSPEKTENPSEFPDFVKRNPWLEDYAPSEESKYIQFRCFSQMAQVKKYANERGIKIMGDLPILLNPDSVDVLSHPEFFSLNPRAGCPPDKFNREGQAWGFPLYRWDNMKADGYSWWKQRIETASTIYDMYRLDHVVGFFRIWAIEQGKLPIEGHYLPRDSSLWKTEGKERLQALLSFSNMQALGEDVGTIPRYVHTTLYELGIPGLVILPWAKKEPSEYPPCTLTTVSTHDTETLNLWWRNNPKEAGRFAEKRGWTWAPTLTKDQRFHILRESHHSTSLFHVNLLQEYLALVPQLTWENIELERVNTPGVISDKNWSTRYPVTVEEIAADPKLKSEVLAILAGSTK